MYENGSVTLAVKGLPREFRDWLSQVCQLTRHPRSGVHIEMQHLLGGLIIAAASGRLSPEKLQKSIEEYMASFDTRLYGRNGPWRDPACRHEVGNWGVWVRFPENGSNGQKKEDHVAETAEVASQN